MSQARIAPTESKSEHMPACLKILSFAGGGVLGTAHIGALLAFQEMGLTDSIEIAAGTSIGAFLALALSLNYPAELLASKLLSKIIDLKKIQDSVIPELPPLDITSIYKVPTYLAKLPVGVIKGFTQIGLCEGKQIEEIAKDLIKESLFGFVDTKFLKKIDDAIANTELRECLLKDKLIYDHSATDKSIAESLNQLKLMIEGKLSLTFEGLHFLKLLFPELKLKDLFVTATNASSDPLTLEMFSYKTKPNMPIEKAIHCSMAATPIYAPVEYDGSTYTDGGYLCNTPHTYFKNEQATKNMPILCVEFGKSGLFEPSKKPMNLKTFFNRLSFFPLAVAAANRRNDEKSEFISLDNLKTCIFDFDLSKEDKMNLISKGYQQTARFLLANKYISTDHFFKLDDHYFQAKLNMASQTNHLTHKV